MENQLTRKYGLLTAICMVVGTVVGSGIFFRNEEILRVTGGNIWIGIGAWVLGGFITLTTAYVFSQLAGKYERAGGIVDYSEALLGEKYGLLFGWFMATMFYPAITGLLAWISARFTVVLFGWDVNPFFSAETYAIASFYLLAIVAMNLLSPKLAGKFQVSTTFIKLVPLVAMGIVGTIVGLFNGQTVENLQSDYISQVVSNPFLTALLATVFAYLGWDAVLSLNAEIRDSKKNLPIALVAGMFVIIIVYVLYFIGIFSSAPVMELTDGDGVMAAFRSIFTQAAGTILFTFIVISCVGTLNGLVGAGQRAFYITAVRKRGLNPKLFSQVDPVTNAPNNAAILFALFVAGWMLINAGNMAGWYGDFNLDLMGLVPVAFQTMLIPVSFFVMIREKEFNFFNRFVAPFAAVCGSIFLVYAIVRSHGNRVIVYAIIFAAIMSVGALIMFRKEK